jgi:hypothetical protein
MIQVMRSGVIVYECLQLHGIDLEMGASKLKWMWM